GAEHAPHDERGQRAEIPTGDARPFPLGGRSSSAQCLTSATAVLLDQLGYVAAFRERAPAFAHDLASEAHVRGHGLQAKCAFRQFDAGFERRDARERRQHWTLKGRESTRDSLGKLRNRTEFT